MAVLHGRTELLAALTAQLDREPGLVTLTGPAGVGKTRVALAWVEASPGTRGVARLLGADGGTAVDEHVAAALGAVEVAGVGRALARGEVRLVLDDVEHLVDALSDRVPRWLAAAPSLRIATTSRAPLGLPGERIVEVPPLDPDAARALLVDRIAAARGARPGPDAEAEIRALATQLDGLPLALEIAAWSARERSVGEVRAELAGRGLVETRGPIGGRHRTLADALASSWDRLDPDARRALIRLSSLRGTFDRTLAAAILGDPEPLSTLVRASLVQRERPTDERRPMRFRVLAAIREHALARATADERAEARDASGAAVVATAEARGALAWSAEGPGALDDLDALADDLFAVARAASDPDLAARALLALEPLAKIRWRFLAVARHEAALARGPSPALASRLRSAIARRLDLARDPRALPAAEAALASAVESGDAGAEAVAAAIAAVVAQRDGRLDEALAYARRAADRAVVLPEVEVEARCRAVLLLRFAGRPGEAEDELARAATVAEPLPYLALEPRMFALQAVHPPDAAIPALASCASQAEALGHLALRTDLERMLAIELAVIGQKDEARRRCDAAMQLLAECGLDNLRPLVEGRFAIAIAVPRRDPEAVRILARMLAELPPGSSTTRALTLCYLALLHADEGDVAGAEATLERFDACDLAHRRPFGVAHVYARAAVELARGHAARAREIADGADRADTSVPNSRVPARSIFARMAAGRGEGAIVVAGDGAWFEVDGVRVELARRGPLRRLVLALAEASAPLDVPALFAAGWPGQRIGAESAAHRVHVAISELRRLGLSGALRTEDSGYRLVGVRSVPRGS